MFKNIHKTILSISIVLMGLMMSGVAFCQSITSFSPASITAGTGSVLTINGTGFGTGGPASNKYVEFTTSNVGSSLVKPLTTDYVSWTDTKIQVKVPSVAGTGKVIVVNATSTITSSASLTITYDIMNANYNNTAFPVVIVNDNNTGGRTYDLYTGFDANTNAKQAFTRAIQTWRCGTGVNWNIGSTTNINTVAADGVNVIRFADSSDDFEAGLLGLTQTFYRSIDGVRWEIVNADITFANPSTVNWNFGTGTPSPSQIDFQSVVTHELGHSHGLQHVNNPADVMNPTSSYGESIRSLSTNDIAAGKYVMGLSTASAGDYIYPPMTALQAGTCDLPVPSITSFTPASASAGATVTINGKNFTGATYVTFGGNPAVSFSVISDTKITAVVATGASGDIDITTPEGIGVIGGFTYIPFKNPIAAPKISYTGPQSYVLNTTITTLKPINNGGTVPATVYGQTSTFAGSSASGSANGTGTAATFSQPEGIAADALGNVYAADTFDALIRKITPSAVVSTLAGSGANGSADGTGKAASFYYPYGVSTDALNNVYITDYYYGIIRKITPAGVVSTIKGAYFYGPESLSVDPSGNIYVSDGMNNAIRRVTASGAVSTLAGNGTAGKANGTGSAATFNNPDGIGLDASGNIYVADTKNNLIRKVTSAGVVTTFAGSGAKGSANGTGTSATFNQPSGIAVDASGNVYVSESENALIRKITPAGVVSTFAGNGTTASVNGVGTAASFTSCDAICIDLSGNLYVTDGNMIRKIIGTGYTISPALPAGLSFDVTTGIITGKPTALSPATDYTITAYNGGGSSTTIVNIAVLDHAKIPLTVTANPQVAIQGQTLPALTLSYSGFTNGDTEASLTTKPVATTTAKSSSSQGYYPITVSGGSSDKYDFKYVQGTLTMVTQSFLAAPITGKVYGNSDFYTFGTSTTGVTYSSSNTKIATVNASGMVHIVGAGTVTITFGNSSGHLTKTLTVGKAPLTIKANDQTAIQGQPLPALTLSYTGFVNGDTQAGFTTQPVVSTTAKASSTQGYYPITVSGGSSANYTFTYAGGTLTMVTQAFLQAALTKTYGNADFYTFGTSTTGVTYSSSNTKVATVNASGLLHIVGAGTTTITFGNSSGHLTKTLTVNKAALKVTADDKTKVVLADNPPLTITYSGFVNGDTKANLTTQPTASTTANASTGPGTYPITVSGGVSTNYAFTYVSGTLTITAPAGHDIPAPQVNAAVSPNGDGINDVMTIAGIDGYPDNKVTLIDKSGAKVFEMSGYDNIGKAFNGYSNITGKLQQAGTYFYKLQYKADGATKNITGYIVLKYN